MTAGFPGSTLLPVLPRTARNGCPTLIARRLPTLNAADRLTTGNSSFWHTRHGTKHGMQIDGADSAGGQRHHDVEIVPDGRPSDIVHSNVCDSVESYGFHNSFCGNSFSKIGSVPGFIATARHLMKSASLWRSSSWASGFQPLRGPRARPLRVRRRCPRACRRDRGAKVGLIGRRVSGYANAAAGLCAGAKGCVSPVLHSSSAGLGCERFSHVHVSCRSEMFLYLVRGIFCGRVQRMKSCDGGLTRLRREKQARTSRLGSAVLCGTTESDRDEGEKPQFHKPDLSYMSRFLKHEELVQLLLGGGGNGSHIGCGFLQIGHRRGIELV